MRILPLLLLLVVAASGCANAPSILPAAGSKSQFDGAVYSGEETVISRDAGGEEYRVFRQGGTGFVTLQSVRDEAEERMTDFCGRQSKAPRPLRERTSVPPHVLGNFPRVEIIFSCVSKPSTAAARDVAVDTKFVKLTNLKRLLDDHVITQQEFEQEKAKVLALP